MKINKILNSAVIKITVIGLLISLPLVSQVEKVAFSLLKNSIDLEPDSSSSPGKARSQVHQRQGQFSSITGLQDTLLEEPILDLKITLDDLTLASYVGQEPFKEVNNGLGSIHSVADPIIAGEFSSPSSFINKPLSRQASVTSGLGGSFGDSGQGSSLSANGESGGAGGGGSSGRGSANSSSLVANSLLADPKLLGLAEPLLIEENQNAATPEPSAYILLVIALLGLYLSVKIKARSVIRGEA